MIRVYRNLHKKVFSVQEKIDGRWKVCEHVSTIFLKNVSFQVSQAGRNRVLNEKRKNVHAYVIGERINALEFISGVGDIRKMVTYNPYKADCFHVVGDPSQKISRAKFVGMWSTTSPTIETWNGS